MPEIGSFSGPLRRDSASRGYRPRNPSARRQGTCFNRSTRSRTVEARGCERGLLASLKLYDTP
jgi:hypothetical protein